MPASVDPKLIIIGVSPGGSPSKDVNEEDYRHGPTILKPRKTNFFYPDENGYWDKIRELIYTYFNEFDNLDLMEVLSLTSHFNLSLESSGSASTVELDEVLVKWISQLLNEVHNPDLVVLLGLKGKIKNNKYQDYWNHAKGLKIMWRKGSRKCIPFIARKENDSFEEWNIQNAQNHQIKVVLWPNHPSRDPVSNNWEESVKQYLSHFKQCD